MGTRSLRPLHAPVSVFRTAARQQLRCLRPGPLRTRRAAPQCIPTGRGRAQSSAVAGTEPGTA
ncbi:hypothetical protein AAP84_25255, partial [Salmonella enterica subsp. enterica]|nr:hypothetical protein [Salmonella enterica subsp. enterica serovar Litchfield]